MAVLHLTAKHFEAEGGMYKGPPLDDPNLREITFGQHLGICKFKSLVAACDIGIGRSTSLYITEGSLHAQNIIGFRGCEIIVNGDLRGDAIDISGTLRVSGNIISRGDVEAGRVIAGGYIHTRRRVVATRSHIEANGGIEVEGSLSARWHIISGTQGIRSGFQISCGGNLSAATHIYGGTSVLVDTDPEDREIRCRRLVKGQVMCGTLIEAARHVPPNYDRERAIMLRSSPED